MAGKLSFSLVSPEREVFNGLVDQVDAPGVEGDFGVLADHAPFMTALREGVVTVIDGGSRRQFEVHGGFADVTPAGLTILAEQASEVASIAKRSSDDGGSAENFPLRSWIRLRLIAGPHLPQAGEVGAPAGPSLTLAPESLDSPCRRGHVLAPAILDRGQSPGRPGPLQGGP